MRRYTRRSQIDVQFSVLVVTCIHLALTWRDERVAKYDYRGNNAVLFCTLSSS